MKIYAFSSGDTTYFTTSRSLKKAQAVGRDNMKHHQETCKYLGEEPTAGKNYFMPEEVEQIDTAEFQYLMKVDRDTMILDDALYNIVKG